MQISSCDGAGAGSTSSNQKVLLDEVKKWKDKISEIGGREGKLRLAIQSLFTRTFSH